MSFNKLELQSGNSAIWRPSLTMKQAEEQPLKQTAAIASATVCCTELLTPNIITGRAKKVTRTARMHTQHQINNVVAAKNDPRAGLNCHPLTATLIKLGTKTSTEIKN